MLKKKQMKIAIRIGISWTYLNYFFFTGREICQLLEVQGESYKNFLKISREKKGKLIFDYNSALDEKRYHTVRY